MIKYKLNPKFMDKIIWPKIYLSNVYIFIALSPIQFKVVLTKYSFYDKKDKYYFELSGCFN